MVKLFDLLARAMAFDLSDGIEECLLEIAILCLEKCVFSFLMSLISIFGTSEYCDT